MKVLTILVSLLLSSPLVDTDGDGIPDEQDNCPTVSNENQMDIDGDGLGDVCDPDNDNDGVPDATDNCPCCANSGQEDIDGDGIGDICDPDNDGDGIDDDVDNCPCIPNPDQEDTNNDGIGDACSCSIEFCSDLNKDGLRDNSCLWWTCESGGCQSLSIVFADVGGQSGACLPDGVADGNDRFHALNCFANQNTAGQLGYPCEDNPPHAFNVDCGSNFGSCLPDGVCDGNDIFMTLNAFGNTTTCSCPLNATMMHASRAATGQPQGQTAFIKLNASGKVIRAGGLVQVELFLSKPLQDLRGYQLHMDVSGGTSGVLELYDIHVDNRPDWAFFQKPAWLAFNLLSGQMVSGMDGDGVTVDRNSYLATFIFRASSRASGRFNINLRTDRPEGRTFFFSTDPRAEIEIKGSTTATIRVR